MKLHYTCEGESSTEFGFLFTFQPVIEPGGCLAGSPQIQMLVLDGKAFSEGQRIEITVALMPVTK